MSENLAVQSKILTENQERAALALAMGADVVQVANVANVDQQTIRRWCKSPMFVARIVEHVDAHTPAALARMRANLTEFMPSILESHSKKAILGNDASARVVIAIWRAMQAMSRSNDDVPLVTPAQIASAHAGNYDVVEGEVVGITISDEVDKVEVGVEVEGMQDKGNYDPRNRSTDEGQSASVFVKP